MQRIVRKAIDTLLKMTYHNATPQMLFGLEVEHSCLEHSIWFHPAPARSITSADILAKISAVQQRRKELQFEKI